MQVVRKNVEVARLFVYLTHTALSLLKIIEVMSAMSIDILYQFVLIDFDWFHSAHGSFDTANRWLVQVWPVLLTFTRSVDGISPLFIVRLQ